MEHIRGQPSYRSRGERRIGELLDEVGVPFRYEAPLLVEDGGRVKIWHPDFQLPDYSTVIEYFGVKNDPDYRRMKERKISVYRDNYIPAIFLSPEDLRPGWKETLLGQVGGQLKRRACHFERLKSTYLEVEKGRLGG